MTTRSVASGPVGNDGATGPSPSATLTVTVPAPRPLGWTRADTIRTVVSLSIAAALIVGAIVLYHASGGSGVGPTAGFSLLAGAALGILFERGRFCFYCIFRDLFEKKNSRGAFSILTALIVGTIGYAFIFTIRMADPSSGRLPTGAHIAPVSLALVFAGIAFGLGVVISQGCIGGHLYRLGEGSMRAIPALIGTLLGFALGFYSWNTIYFRFISGSPSPWLPTSNGYWLALALQLGVLVALAIVLLKWNPPVEGRTQGLVDGTYMRRAVFFKRWPALLTGALVGLVGVVAYLRDRPLGVTSQLSSATRSVLDSNELLPSTLYGLDQTLAGCVALVVETITNNGWLIIGIVLASFAAALPGRRVKLEKVDAVGSSKAVLGGVLLGWGATIGLGCSIGTFLSGIQAMALSGWVFGIAMVATMAVGFRLKLHRR